MGKQVEKLAFFVKINGRKMKKVAQQKKYIGRKK